MSMVGNGASLSSSRMPPPPLLQTSPSPPSKLTCTVLMRSASSSSMRKIYTLPQPRLWHCEEKLFLLWGDLEERKVKQAKEEANVLKEVDGNKQSTGRKDTRESKRWPFQCCLKEYGVKVKRGDGEACDEIIKRQTGDPQLWERRWRLWGCTINLANGSVMLQAL